MTEGLGPQIELTDQRQLSPDCMQHVDCNVYIGYALARVEPAEGVTGLGWMNTGTLACNGLRGMTEIEQARIKAFGVNCPIPQRVCDMQITYTPVTGE